jgi:hypothetical protein
VDRLTRRTVGRVSGSEHALPTIVVVRYVVDRHDVVFYAPFDPGFAKACDGAVIAFEADDISELDGDGWTVQLVGVATTLTSEEEPRHQRSTTGEPAIIWQCQPDLAPG